MTHSLERPAASDHGLRLLSPVAMVSEDDLPVQHMVTCLNWPSEIVGTYAGHGVLNSQWYFRGVSWTTTDLAEMSFDFYLASGTWRCEWFSDLRADYGIQQMFVNGTPVGAPVDHYAATRVRNIHEVQFVAESHGPYRITRKVNGKNPASANFLMTFSALMLSRID